MEFTLYILESAEVTFYIGHTDNLDSRLAQHEQGTGRSYTSARRRSILIHAEGYGTRYAKSTMERKLKGWSRAKKLAYMPGDWKAYGRTDQRQTQTGSLACQMKNSHPPNTGPIIQQTGSTRCQRL